MGKRLVCLESRLPYMSYSQDALSSLAKYLAICAAGCVEKRKTKIVERTMSCSLFYGLLRQNVVRTVKNSPRVPPCSYHILMSSVTYYWRDTATWNLFVKLILSVWCCLVVAALRVAMDTCMLCLRLVSQPHHRHLLQAHQYQMSLTADLTYVKPVRSIHNYSLELISIIYLAYKYLLFVFRHEEKRAQEICSPWW